MKILGIETSCDETAAAVVEDGTTILSSVVASSADFHIKTGGIIPENAARKQVEYMIPTLLKAMQGFSPKDIDSISVTAGGPGLIGSMLVGVETAKTLSLVWQKPIVPVVHLLAHVYANFIETQNSTVKTNKHNSKLKTNTPHFPAVVLTVAGGHTELILMKGHGDFEIIGSTRDDAAGETFDKCARILGLPYPGGPSIAAEAEKFKLQSSSLKLKMFPRPMINDETLDFSFSGLKTAVLRKTEENKNLDRSWIAAEIQEAIVDVLVEKTLKAAKKFKVKNILVAGGVAANIRLGEIFKSKIETQKLTVNLFVPPPKLCTDNATFIASYAFFNNHPMKLDKIVAIPDHMEAIKIYANNKSK